MGEALYPRGAIAMGNGDLIDVTDVKIDTTNNAKQVHTIRQKGAGITLGTQETTISFNAVVSDEGPEADWLKLVKKGTIKQLRIKTPGETDTCNGVFQSTGKELPLDDAIKIALTFIGHLVD